GLRALCRRTLLGVVYRDGGDGGRGVRCVVHLLDVEHRLVGGTATVGTTETARSWTTPLHEGVDVEVLLDALHRRHQRLLHLGEALHQLQRILAVHGVDRKVALRGIAVLHLVLAGLDLESVAEGTFAALRVVVDLLRARDTQGQRARGDGDGGREGGDIPFLTDPQRVVDHHRGDTAAGAEGIDHHHDRLLDHLADQPARIKQAV